MSKTNEINPKSHYHIHHGVHPANSKTSETAAPTKAVGGSFSNPTAYLEKVGFDSGKYKQAALNLKYERTLRAESSSTSKRSFPKPSVRNRFTARPGAYGSRNGTDIDAIVLHHTAGSTASGAANALNNRGLSVHYIVDKDGKIYQMVGDEKRAFHAGQGSGKWENANSRSIGIEIVNLGNGTDKYTEAQYKALEKLVPHLAQKYKIPVKNIVRHSEIGNPSRPAGNPEPSRNFDFARIRESVNGDAPAPKPTAPKPNKPDKPDNTTAPTAFLRHGNRGGQVKKLQDALVKLGYMTRAQVNTGPGIFGPRTERGLKAFQRDHKDGSGRQLAADGIYGALTRGALRRVLQRSGDNVTAPKAILRRGNRSSQVEQLQNALVKLDYMTRAQVDTGPGIFGPRTERGLRAFQRDHKDLNGRQLAVDGIYGPKTRGALRKALKEINGSQPNPKPEPKPEPKPNGGGKVKIKDIEGVKGNPNVTPAFLREVNRMAKRLDTKPQYLLAVMSFESGLNPKAVNPTSGATGLIQFLPSTARGLGTTTAALKNMSSVEQLKFVEKYFQPFKGKLGTLEGTYTAVLAGTAKPNPNDVLFRSGTPEYNGNKGLDFNRNGKITSGEATSAVAAKMFGGVRKVQQKLENLGFNPKGVDGIFGPNTSKALADFQRSRKLPVTGLLNERTGLALMKAERIQKPDKDGSKPSGRPAQGPITSGFGPRNSPAPGASRFHEGIDIGAPTGTRVQSTAPGKVIYAGSRGTAGNAVIIDHGNGYQTRYYHLSKINVRVGQRVGDSQRIGAVGSTGNSTGPHLHYEVRRNGKAINPANFF